MTKALFMGRKIKRSGSAWRDTDSWSVHFDSSAIFDPIIIRNNQNLAEKLAMNLEEADAFVDFIQEAKRAYAKYLKHQEDPVGAFAEPEGEENVSK